VATLTGILMAWAFSWYGGPVEWLRFLAHIALRYDAKVAVLPGAVREWVWAPPWFLLTSFAGVAGWVLAIAASRSRSHPMTAGMRLTLMIGGLNFALTAWLMNSTFSLSIYFASGLLAAVVAAMPPTKGWMRAVTLALLGVLVTADLAHRGVRTLRLRKTWTAGNPAPLDAFVRAHVPAGSYVYGPDVFYLYAVERADSRYLLATPSRGQQWTRLVEPGTSTTLDAARPRYLIWPADDWYVGPLPPLACPGSQMVARFEPPPHPGPIQSVVTMGGLQPSVYEETVLLRLPEGCVGP
jgi:hypothetical protein